MGPPSLALAAVGNKLRARALARKLGIPILPGLVLTRREAETGLTAGLRRRVHAEIGFPLVVKAASGGGGKGMRRVDGPGTLASALREARAEARSAFGDPTVYLERFLVAPRHIEIQAFADDHGNVATLGERECSVQRRHQKLFEETPSPAVDKGLRMALGAGAVALLKGAGYRNAGTVEFLLETGRHAPRFYFLEANTRIQVEHPVTECVLGLDLVALQIAVTEGRALPACGALGASRGWAMESRVCAEDPGEGFLPSTGRITGLAWPSGPGVRVDAGVDTGSNVTPYYDPLIAKIITWGPDRETARRRMRRALGETVIVGVRTTVPFLLRLLDHPDFRSGRLDTGLAARVAGATPGRNGTGVAEIALAAALEHQRRERGAPVHSETRADGLRAWRRASLEEGVARGPAEA